jgi:hypothetical protein
VRVRAGALGAAARPRACWMVAVSGRVRARHDGALSGSVTRAPISSPCAATRRGHDRLCRPGLRWLTQDTRVCG